MRFTLAALLGSALVARQALAELTFTVAATKDGVPIPQSEIKLEPMEFGTGRVGHATPAQGHRRFRRANAAATSANWCGAVNTASSSNQIKVVHASFQHPSCSTRTGATYPQAAAAWAGIDGDSHTSALLQAGTVCKIDNSTGIVRHEAWWQWVPEAANTVTSLPVAPHDYIEITINTNSTTAAEITLTNVSKGYTYTVSIRDGPALARVDADWVVERPYYGATLAGFPTFTDVWFDEAYATRVSGANLGVLGSKQYQIPNLCASIEDGDAAQVSWSL
ncbi:concanavalin A-like lectin/glucanase domain-containing protein [Chaetomium strumarium]|uniref:Concanavalin A-like lectin/glucanase domain-containing protein n=1 Tax=Chaetomium strumarium TaxID=1170767 RepID=A0AAJ0LZ91_9PEZI|nr:concanavalin A-like lectin/glucanase domain-containing protein [Chaetomium strumarium]